MVVLDPVTDVQVVNVLLADVVAAEPDEMVPVAHLVFHFGHFRRAVAEPRLAAVPVGLAEDHVADRAIVDLLDAVDVALLVAALQADDHLEVLLVGQLVGLQQAAEAGGVDAAGLLHEDVFAGGNRRRIVDGAETGRAWQSAPRPGRRRSPSGRRRSRRTRDPRADRSGRHTSFSRSAAQPFARSAKASATAISLTFSTESRQFTAAPVPRPPQPIRAIFNSSPPAAWAERAKLSPPAKASPAAAAVLLFRKSRRDGMCLLLIVMLLGGKKGETLNDSTKLSRRGKCPAPGSDTGRPCRAGPAGRRPGRTVWAFRWARGPRPRPT